MSRSKRPSQLKPQPNISRACASSGNRALPPPARVHPSVHQRETIFPTLRGRKRRLPPWRHFYLYIFFSIAKSAARHSCVVSLLLQLCVRKNDRREEREGKWLQFIMEMARRACDDGGRKAGLDGGMVRSCYEPTQRQPTGRSRHEQTPTACGELLLSNLTYRLF